MAEDPRPSLGKLALYIGFWTLGFGALGLGFLGFTLPVPLVAALGVSFGGFSWVLNRGVRVADALVFPARPNASPAPSESNKDPRAYQLAQAIRAAFVHDDWARLSRIMTELADVTSTRRHSALSAGLQSYLAAARTSPATARLKDQASLSRHIEELSRP